MAFTQTATSVTSFTQLGIGHIGVSLTNYTTSALSAIASGSVLEVAGATFYAGTQIAINASSWTAISSGSTAYLEMTPSGSAGSQILTGAWSTTDPTWREDMNAWYHSAASSIRTIGSAYKVSATQQESKTLYIKGRDRIFIKKLDIGDWNMDADGSPAVGGILHYLLESKILNVTAMIYPDTGTTYQPLTIHFETITASVLTISNGGYIQIRPTDIVLIRTPSAMGTYATISGLFDGVGFDSTSFNRGEVIITYEA